MGYTVTGGATLALEEGQHAAALEALKQWGREQESIPWGDDNGLQAAADLHQAWRAIGFESYGEGDTIEVSHCDSWAQEYDEAAEVLRPFLDLDASASEWEGEEGECWTWTHPSGPERFALKVWNAPELRAALDTFRAAANHHTAAALAAQVADALGVTE